MENFLRIEARTADKSERAPGAQAPDLPLRDRMGLDVLLERPKTRSRSEQLESIFDYYKAKYEERMEDYSKAMSHRTRNRAKYVSRRRPAFFIRSEQAKAYLEMATELTDPESGAPFGLSIGIKEELCQYFMEMHSKCAILAKTGGGKEGVFRKPKVPEGCFAVLGKGTAYRCAMDYVRTERDKTALR